MFTYMIVILIGATKASASVDLWISKAETERLLGFSTEIYYIQDGLVNLYAANFSMVIPASISTLHFNWLRKSPRKWRYRIDIEADNTAMFSAKSLSVPRQGLVPESSSVLSLHVPCNARVQGETELRLHVRLQAETPSTDSASARKRRVMTSSLMLRRRRVCRHSDDVTVNDKTPQATRAFVLSNEQVNSAQSDMWLHVIVGCVCGAALVATFAVLAVIFRRKLVVSDCRQNNKCPDRKEVPLYSPVDCHQPPCPSSHEYASVEELLYTPAPSCGVTKTSNSLGRHYAEPYAHEQRETFLAEIKSDRAVQSPKKITGAQCASTRHYNCCHGDSSRSSSYSGRSRDFCSGERQSTRDQISRFQMKREQLQLEMVLQQGSFSQLAVGWMVVEESEESTQKQRCLVKLLRGPVCRRSGQDLWNTALAFGRPSHSGLQTVCGVVLDENHSPMLLYPNVTHPSLKSFLRGCRWSPAVSGASGRLLRIHNVVVMATQLADALNYLHLRQICHRDIATRNCCCDDLMNAKLWDAVSSSDLYPEDYTVCTVVTRSNPVHDNSTPCTRIELLPVRWMAPEVLAGNTHSTCSDIWSFGVLLWELVSLAALPYYRQLITAAESRNVVPAFRYKPPATPCQPDGRRLTADLLKMLRDGSRLLQPDVCPDQLYNVMQQCWQWKASDRPSSAQLLNSLLEFSNQLRNFA